LPAPASSRISGSTTGCVNKTEPAVTTVLGPIAADALGITLPHEHLLIDLTCLQHPPETAEQEGLAGVEPSGDNRAALSADPYVNRSNLLLDDVETAVRELEAFRELGGGTVVDLTVEGIAPRPVELREIAGATGVQVVMGCGLYVQAAHPGWVREASVEELADWMEREIEEGIGGTGIRPGIIGELGTSSPVQPDEEKVLRAGARAQRVSGLAINVHVAIFQREALRVLEILEGAGADLPRVIISHLDENLDLGYHRAILERGATVEYDTFGSKFAFAHRGARESSDGERIEALLRLLDEGWEKQILLSQDVCTKLHLLAYGGYGYGHLLRTIVPRLRERGVGESTLRTMMVTNPARLLGR